MDPTALDPKAVDQAGTATRVERQQYLTWVAQVSNKYTLKLEWARQATNYLPVKIHSMYVLSLHDAVCQIGASTNLQKQAAHPPQSTSVVVVDPHQSNSAAADLLSYFVVCLHLPQDQKDPMHA